MEVPYSPTDLTRTPRSARAYRYAADLKGTVNRCTDSGTAFARVSHAVCPGRGPFGFGQKRLQYSDNGRSGRMVHATAYPRTLDLSQCPAVYAPVDMFRFEEERDWKAPGLS